MKPTRVGTMPRPLEIQLEKCENVVQFLQTIEKITQLLKDLNNIPFPTAHGLKIKLNSGVISKVHTLMSKGTDIDQVREKIIKFIQINEEWYPLLNFEKSIRPFYDLPIFKNHSRKLDQLKEDVRDVQGSAELIRQLRNEPPNRADMEDFRRDQSCMDIVFLSSDQKEVWAHEVFLSQKYPTDLSKVADAKTIELFLDIEYKVENIEKLTGESFSDLLKLAEYLKNRKLKLKIVELFIRSLYLPHPPLVAAIPFILALPNELFCSKLFQAILRVVHQNREIYESFLWALVQREMPKEGNAIHIFLLGYFSYKQENPIDQRQAFELFQRATNLGLPLAVYFLGKCYRDGIGVAASSTMAMGLFKQAAQLNISKAWISLGNMYRKWENRVFPDEAKNMKVIEDCYEEARRLKAINLATTLEHSLPP